MLDKNFSTIENAIKKAIHIHPQRDKISNAAVIHAWKNLLPHEAQKQVTALYIKNKKLFVKIESSALKHTIHINKICILEKINAMSSEASLIDIVLL